MAKFIPRHCLDERVRRYLAGETLTAAAAALGYSQTACRNEMIRRGLPIRTSSVVKRRYTIDPSAWDAPMTESAAYWLGFFAGDGSVGKGRRVPPPLVRG